MRNITKTLLESLNNLKESDYDSNKKVIKVEVSILPTIKFLWAEGNQNHVAALFGSDKEHDMDFSKFQNAVYVLDQEVSERNGGYDKVKYIANIHVKFTYEDGSIEEEDTTYTGRVDCGDGYKYVTVSKNMKRTIQEDYKDAEVIIREDDTAELKESAETGKITLKDYAMNYFDGDIDMDVTDTEVDMLVAFVYDFNEEPKDNYDRFLNLLGERTKVVKVDNNNVLTCDFSSVFKPYEDKLQGFFDMDYSEFNEAYYEAVDNLEALISGNAGEKAYGELIDILTSKQINESASIDVNNLTKEQLWKLRQEIVLGSLYTSDYDNSFGINPSAVCSFFDGFIEDAQMDDYGKPNNRKTEEYDNAEDLYDYYRSCENPFGEINNMNESASYEGYTDNEIIKDVINNFKKITGKDVKNILNYNENNEGFFKQDEVESTGKSIINYLTKKGVSRSHIDELLYKLDDELTSLWNKL